ncbi:MAG: hypothetical protein JOZ75_12920 [Candidatus Dormibacteraeota bacterium]|nr:hypothetical protein [Candidatus Dormibacteraeota bacterium]
MIPSYSGPATYQISAVDVGGFVGVDNTTYNLENYLNRRPTASAIVRSDGSGSMTATDLIGDELGASAPAGSLSLSMTWVCVPNYS